MSFFDYFKDLECQVSTFFSEKKVLHVDSSWHHQHSSRTGKSELLSHTSPAYRSIQFSPATNPSPVAAVAPMIRSDMTEIKQEEISDGTPNCVSFNISKMSRMVIEEQRCSLPCSVQVLAWIYSGKSFIREPYIKQGAFCLSVNRSLVQFHGTIVYFKLECPLKTSLY